MWGGLAVIAVSQLALDVFYPAFDQWAHGAGLVAGALLGFALSPAARWSRTGRVAGRVVALGFGTVAVVAASLVVRTSLPVSLARGGLARRQVAGIALRVPAGWYASTAPPSASGLVTFVGQASQPDGLVTMRVVRGPRTSPGEQVKRWLDQDLRDPDDKGHRDAQDEELRNAEDSPVRIARASEPLIALPGGWEGGELVVVQTNGMGYDQRWRRLMCGRVFGDQAIFVVIEVPETIASAAPEFFARLLASIGPA